MLEGQAEAGGWDGLSKGWGLGKNVVGYQIVGNGDGSKCIGVEQWGNEVRAVRRKGGWSTWWGPSVSASITSFSVNVSFIRTNSQYSSMQWSIQDVVPVAQLKSTQLSDQHS